MIKSIALNNKRIALALALVFLTGTPLYGLANEYVLEEGTPIRLTVLDTISSGSSREGDSVSLQVVDDVLDVDGETVLIKAGTPAWGVISEAQRRGRIGEKGEVALTIDATKAVNGKKVPLRANINREGQSKLGSVVTLGLLVTPLFLLMRGKDAKIPAGTRLSAFVDRDVRLSLAHESSGTTNKQTDAKSSVNTANGKNDSNKDAVPDYLKKYQDTPSTPSSKPIQDSTLQALDQLYEQGILTQAEYEAKKQSLQRGQ